ncbi:MAG TPA: hypothetical protein VG797_07470 [Phycisphaerales bacterium]|nr:hypothetical protein [Phycisphaerales bacterium]
MKRLWEKFKSLPRSVRWLAFFLIALVVPYFLIVEPVMDRSSDLSSQADQLQSSLKRSADRAARAESAGQSLALGQTRFGAIKFPGDSKQIEALNERIQEIFDAHPVSSMTQKSLPPALIGKDVMAGVLKEGEQLQRVQVQLTFETTPDSAMAIIADLERAPEVYVIGRTVLRKLEKDGKRLVTAQLYVETWIVTPKGGAKA